MSHVQTLDKPASLVLPRRFWVAAAVIAGLRQAVNDRFRAVTRDRGQAKNFLNDLQGVVGELVVVRHLEIREAHPIEHDLLDLDGPVDDLDVRFTSGGHSFGVESKCLLMEPNKRLFLINVIAHARSQARGADGYAPVLAAPGGSRAIIGSLIPQEAVSDWPKHAFQYGDPAFGVPLSQLAKLYCGLSERDLTQFVSSETGRHGLVAGDLDVIARKAADRIFALSSESPPLRGMSAVQIVEFCNDFVGESDI